MYRKQKHKRHITVASYMVYDYWSGLKFHIRILSRFSFSESPQLGQFIWPYSYRTTCNLPQSNTGIKELQY